VPDPGKAGRQNKEKEAPYQLCNLKSHEFDPVLVLVIFPLKLDGVSVKNDDPGIGNSNSVGVTAQVANNMPGGLERLFAVNNLPGLF